MRSRYKKALAWCLQRRVAVVGGAAAIFALSLMSLKFLPLEFAPAQDTGALFLAFQAPSGKSLEYTSSKIKEFEEVARQHPEVDRTFIAIGGYGQGGQGNRGNGVVILKDLANRKKSQFEVASELRDMAKKIEGINIFIRDRSGSAFAGRRGSPVEFTISGPDPDKQREYYYEMKKAMEESGLIVGVRSDDALVIPEVQIVPDRREARDRGVEISTIADTINATFGGVVAAEYTQGSRRFEIFVQLQDTDRSRREDIQNVLIRNNRGELLPLSEVVDTVSTTGPQNIFREDRVRGLRVDGDLSQGAKLGDAVKVVREASARILPADYYIRFQETPDDKLMDTVMIMLLGLIIAYMVLATQFNSFTDPMIVFLAVPFALTGSLIGLLAGGQTLNIYSVIGIMLTMGIVKKVAILIIEFTNHLRDQGKDLNEALLEACTVRFRPILMTTTATLAAAVPPALALGPGAETRIPLALTVLGGVSISAVLSLLVVPCVYSLMNPKRRAVLEETPERLTVLHSGERRVPAQK